MNYYTPRDLAKELRLTTRTARRVLAEAGLRHERGQWWRFDLGRESEALSIEELLRAVQSGKTRFGRKQRRCAGQLALFEADTE